MSVVGDELTIPAFGLSAPNLEYPLVTQLGDVAANLAVGLAVAGTVDAGWAVVCRP